MSDNRVVGEHGSKAGSDVPIEPLRPKLVNVTAATSPEERKALLAESWPPLTAQLFDFLKTPQGATLSARVSDLFDALKRKGVDQQAADAKAKHRRELTHLWARYALVAGIIGASVWLQIEGKLDSVIVAVLSGAMGYLFGRQKSE